MFWRRLEYIFFHLFIKGQLLFKRFQCIKNKTEALFMIDKC